MKNTIFMKITPLAAYVACEIEYFDNLLLLEWARASKHLEEYVDDPNVTDLISINNKQPTAVLKAINLFEEIFKTHWKQACLSENTESIAQSLFMLRLKEYVDRQCTPYDLCKMVAPIETIYDYPEWLGNMYDSCDWIKPGDSRARYSHLESDARELLFDLSKNANFENCLGLDLAKLND